MICIHQPAFGYIITKTTTKTGEENTDETFVNNVLIVKEPVPDWNYEIMGTSNFSFAWCMLKGVHEYINLETGEKILHERGFTNITHPFAPGKYKCNVLEDSEFICFSSGINVPRIPPLPALELFHLNTNENVVLPLGTKLYLFDGVLSVDDKTIPSMRQVKVTTKDTMVTAAEECYGYLFK